MAIGRQLQQRKSPTSYRRQSKIEKHICSARPLRKTFEKSTIGGRRKGRIGRLSKACDVICCRCSIANQTFLPQPALFHAHSHHTHNHNLYMIICKYVVTSFLVYHVKPHTITARHAISLSLLQSHVIGHNDQLSLNRNDPTSKACPVWSSSASPFSSSIFFFRP